MLGCQEDWGWVGLSQPSLPAKLAAGLDVRITMALPVRSSSAGACTHRAAWEQTSQEQHGQRQHGN